MENSTSEQLVERLFQAVIGVEKNLERHGTILETMVGELKGIKLDRQSDLAKHDERVRQLELEFRQGTKTQWPVIFSTMGAGFTVLSLVGAVIAYAWFGDVNSLHNQYTALRDDLNSHARLHGHPEAVIEQLEGLEKNIDKRFELQGKRIDRVEDRTKLLYKEGNPY